MGCAVGLVCFLAIAAPAISSTPASLLPFDATIALSTSLSAVGRLESPPGVMAYLAWRPSEESLSNGPLLATPLLGFSTLERRWQTFDRGDDGPEISWGLTEVKTLEVTLRKARVEPVSYGPDAHWLVKSIAGLRPVGAESCQIEPAEANPTVDVDLLPGIGETGLSVRCPQAVEYAAGASARFEFQDGELRIFHEKALKQRNFTVVAGNWTVRNSTNPDILDHRFRQIEVRTIYQSQFVVGRDAAATMWSPSLSTSGTLEIEEAVGVVRWGTWQTEGLIPSLRPSGDFILQRPPLLLQTLPDAWPLRLSGVATNGPPVARGPDAPRAGGLEGWWLPSLAALAAAAALWAYLKKWLPWGLFTRIAGQQAQLHRRRQLLLDAIGANPGHSVQRLAKLLQWSRNVTAYHARVLLKHGLVKEARFRGIRGFYLREDPAFHEHGRTHVLSSPSATRLLRALGASPEASQRALASVSGLTQASVSTWLQAMERVGLVRVERGEGRRRYQVVARGTRSNQMQENNA